MDVVERADVNLCVGLDEVVHVDVDMRARVHVVANACGVVCVCLRCLPVLLAYLSLRHDL